MTLLATARETFRDELLEDFDEDRAAVEPDERVVQRCTTRRDDPDERVIPRGITRDDPDEALEDPAELARQSLLAAIVLGRAPTLYGAARWAWSSLESLVAAGHAVETIEGLEAAGWLTRWSTAVDDEPPSWSNPSPAPTGLVVTLTAWGAERLGVEVRESRDTERPHWAPALERQPRFTPCPRWLRHGGCQLELPEAIQDSAPSPLEEIVMVETFSEDGGRSNLEPLKLLGSYVYIDPRLGAAAKPKAGGKSKKTGRDAKKCRKGATVR